MGGIGHALSRISKSIGHAFSGGGLFNAILPGVVGTLVGGPLGAYMGMGGALGATAGGALAGGLTSSLTGGKFLSGAVGGGLGGWGSIPAGDAATAAQSIAATAGGDPITALTNAIATTGADTATEAAAKLGFGSVDSMLASMNPSWLATGALLNANMTNALTNISPSLTGATPSAQQSGVLGNVMSALGKVPSSATGLGALSSGINAYTGLQQIELAKQMQKQAQQADPMAQYRAGYAKQLADLQNNPSSITSMPGYQAGLEAVQRSMAAQGYTGSGNMMAALQKYGGDFYQQQFNNLASLANSNPSASLRGQAAAAQLAASGANRLGYTASSFGW